MNLTVFRYVRSLSVFVWSGVIQLKKQQKIYNSVTYLGRNCRIRTFKLEILGCSWGQRSTVWTNIAWSLLWFKCYILSACNYFYTHLQSYIPNLTKDKTTEAICRKSTWHNDLSSLPSSRNTFSKNVNGKIISCQLWSSAVMIVMCNSFPCY